MNIGGWFCWSLWNTAFFRVICVHAQYLRLASYRPKGGRKHGRSVDDNKHVSIHKMYVRICSAEHKVHCIIISFSCMCLTNTCNTQAPTVNEFYEEPTFTTE